MFRKHFPWPGLALCLAMSLAGCEKPEEALTPPAALEQSAGKSQATEKQTDLPQPGMTDSGEELADEWDEEPSDDPALEPPVEDVYGDGSGAEADEGAEGEDAEESAAETAPAEPIALFPPELLGAGTAHICFFSFNTGTEYYQLKRMVQRLNETSPIQITVSEYQMLDSEPYDSFVALLESGKQCDGLVLSGHHTDEFYGERSDGDLEVEDLEELACDPRYSSWFANIKALWLQGCNTALPVFHNEDVDDDDYRVTDSPIALLERWLDPDDMEDSVEDMTSLLDENINRENMVNHYMRVFSGATVYGWSFKAPGEQAGAQKSIPYHIAQVSRLVDGNPRYFENPLQTRIPDTAAQRYSEVLYGVLKRPSRPDGTFPAKLNESTFVQGWRDHGNYRYRYTFDNHDIEAFPALLNSNNEVLRQLKGLTCLLQQLDDDLDDMSMLDVADYILRDRNLTSYNSYLLWAMLRNMPEGSAEHQQLRQRLSHDDHLVNELRYAAGRSGYSQQDARAFLAMLDPPTPAAAVQPAVAEQSTAEEPRQAENAEPSDGSGTQTTEDFEQTEPDTTQSASTETQAEPWYMNDEAAPASPTQDDEQTFEFKADR